MTQELKNAIKDSINQLQSEINSLSFSELALKLESIYEKALLADYISKVETRKSTVLAGVAQAAAAHTEEKAAPKPTHITTETQKKEAPDFSMNPEIKVLPHPEGPPVMREKEDAPAPENNIPAPQTNTPTTQTIQPPSPQHTPAKAKVESIAERAQQTSKTASLNDRLGAQKLSFGLNDRIAYVKHLFNGQGEDFTRVVNQLNTYEAWQEAETFINEMVKPDYNWAGKEDYESRFLAQVKARFDQ